MAKGKKTGGRQVGTPNKSTAELRELARSYAPAVMSEIARLALNAESESARIAAAKELLDRGYGKSVLPITGSADGVPIQVEHNVDVIVTPDDIREIAAMIFNDPMKVARL